MTKRHGSNRMKKKKASTSIDRLSDLPDGILCHVLSFLEIRDSVATSILSSRWRFLWTDVPRLDFNSNDFVDLEVDFSDIIDRVVALHKVKPLNYFHLWFSEMDEYDCTDDQLEKWITSAVTRSVNNIDIYIPNRALPQCLFTCQTVVDLTLSRCKWIHTAVHLPVLKKFAIKRFIYESDESLPHLLSGCPVLEELFVGRRADDGMVCCNISSPTLKRLSLVSITYRSSHPLPGHRVLINAPNLKYLHLEDLVYEHVSVGELPSLVEAEIGIAIGKDKEYDVLYSQSVLEFVARLGNVKSLKLRMNYARVLGSTFSSWTTRFHNLTELVLEADWRFISMFLENADNLQVLILREVNEDMKCWMEPRKVPTCLSSHLRTITFCHFISAMSEFEMVKYLLRDAKVLERMVIYSRAVGCELLDLREGFEALQRISMFQRGSEACVVNFI